MSAVFQPSIRRQIKAKPLYAKWDSSRFSFFAS
jgi:hypothetical protein